MNSYSEIKQHGPSQLINRKPARAVFAVDAMMLDLGVRASEKGSYAMWAPSEPRLAELPRS